MLRATPSLQTMIATVAGALVALALFVGNVGAPAAGMSERDTDPIGDFQRAAVGPGDFCPGQTAPTDLGALVKLNRGQMWMPDGPQASRESLRGRALCTGTPTLQFDSGITVAFEDGWRGVGTPGHWQAMAEQWGEGDVGQVLGRPAFLLAPSERFPLGEVLVVIGDTLVRATGDSRQSLSQIAAVVNSIEPGKPLTAGG